MIKINTYNQNGEVAGEYELPGKIFGVKANESLIHQAVTAQLANERQVLAHTKIRSEVSGGGKKPWKQKGTGRARAGSSRSPIWIGGGVTFGPRKDRNFKKDINKKMKQKALFMVLTDRVTNNSMAVMDKMDLQEFKTRDAVKIVKNLETKVLPQNKEYKKYKRSILMVNKSDDDKAKYSFRNIEGLKIINLDNLNIVDILNHKNIVITKELVDKIVKQYNK